MKLYYRIVENENKRNKFEIKKIRLDAEITKIEHTHLSIPQKKCIIIFECIFSAISISSTTEQLSFVDEI